MLYSRNTQNKTNAIKITDTLIPFKHNIYVEKCSNG